MSASILASLSLITRPSMRRNSCHQIVVRGLNPQLHRVGDGEPAAGHLLERFQLRSRHAVGEEHVLGAAELGATADGSNSPNTLSSMSSVSRSFMLGS